MLKELSEWGSQQHEKYPARNEEYNKMNNLQGHNSRVDEAECQINALEHKEAKTTIITTRRKKNAKKTTKKMNIV